LLRTHYRSTIVFSEEGIEEAGQGLDTFLRFFERFQRVTGESYFSLPLFKTRAAGDFAPEGNELLTEVQAHRASYLTKMDDDFNTGGAMSDLFDLLRTLNKYCEQHKLDDPAARTPAVLAPLKRGVMVLRELLAILGLFLQAPVVAAGEDDGLANKLVGLFIEMRAEARKDKNFKLSDRIRDGLTAIGITLEDRKDGTSWRKA
ncbi:MAG TPA: DALR domain-containing protein, partial [Pirellulaceae bacterium]|nr:DALR domain-containing protein [Pirellulaceae bacterium]